MIPGQMNIYDFLYPEKINPIREVAKNEQPYFTNSKNRIIALLESDADINELWHVVRREYCPYGQAGHYGSGHGPNTVEGWTLKNGGIEVVYYNNNCRRLERAYSWADFSREIFDLWCSGEYGGE